jgi:SAM-dependent methyltransferase
MINANNAMPLVKTESKTEWYNSDFQFNSLYPFSIQALAKYHWTPLSIAVKAAKFLAAEDNVRILDIGSGVGKFCLAAANHTPKANYFGVEQRKSLINFANATKRHLQLDNVSFIHGNFTQLDLKKYDHFYFYNAFYENLDGADKIDDSKGTKVCKLCSLEDKIPGDFHLISADMDDPLKFWIKI